MKSFYVIPGLFCIALFFASCGGGGNTETAKQQADTTSAAGGLMSDDELIKRGEHLVMTGACGDCHAPKKPGTFEPDMALWLSGHPSESKLPPSQPGAIKAGWILMGPDLTSFSGPWGTSFAANLTPDTATGIGTWTENNFFTAIKNGKFHGLASSRDLLPPMPWQWIKNNTDDDLRAIFTYLKSIKPVSNAVPAPLPPQ